jgi:hypothetical protein
MECHVYCFCPDRTILHLVKKNPRPPPPLKNYGMHTIKPQLRPCNIKLKIRYFKVAFRHLMVNFFIYWQILKVTVRVRRHIWNIYLKKKEEKKFKRICNYFLLGHLLWYLNDKSHANSIFAWGAHVLIFGDSFRLFLHSPRNYTYKNKYLT